VALHRLFVALAPPAGVARLLTGLMGGVEGARWQTEAQLHATLLFIGEVDRHQANAIAERLAALRAAPLAVRLGAFGAFDSPRTGRLTALWIGLEPQDGLTALARKVGRCLLEAGVPPETRRFTPHITLARFPARGAPAHALDRFLAHTPPPAAAWRADALILYESCLGQGGAHYRPVLAVPLARAVTESSAGPHPPPA
jgi:2'-5' RNA ligase